MSALFLKMNEAANVVCVKTVYVKVYRFLSHVIQFLVCKFTSSQIWDALRNLVPFAQFKNLKNTHEIVSLFTLLHGCFSHF